MRIEIPTQPLPEHVAEACAWLSAAERYCEPRQPTRQRDRATAAEALNILLDVDPSYPVIDTTRLAVPLAVAAPRAICALELAIRVDGPPNRRLCLARALWQRRQATR